MKSELKNSETAPPTCVMCMYFRKHTYAIHNDATHFLGTCVGKVRDKWVGMSDSCDDYELKLRSN
jgi:hypothetical protein